MIAFLHGELLFKNTAEIVLNVGGVGYLVSIPLTTFCELPKAFTTVQLHIQTIVKEDAINLYGFLTEEEKTLFNLLRKVSKIGPKISLTIVSKMSFPEFLNLVQAKDIVEFSKIPGIGKKTAERILFELHGKFEKQFEEQDQQHNGTYTDVVGALVNLGYGKRESEKALRLALTELGQQATLEQLIPASLKLLNSKE